MDRPAVTEDNNPEEIPLDDDNDDAPHEHGCCGAEHNPEEIDIGSDTEEQPANFTIIDANPEEIDIE